MTLLAVSVWVLLACVADVLFKSARGFDRLFLVGVCLYAISSLPALYVYAYEKAKFGYVAIVWCAASVLIGLLVASVFFHERFTIRRAISAALAIAAVVLSE